MTLLLPVYHGHCESIEQESFLRMLLGRSWFVFAVLVFLLAGCASNRQQQQHSPDKPFFDTPDVDSLH